jgi:hypothetical protein
MVAAVTGSYKLGQHYKSPSIGEIDNGGDVVLSDTAVALAANASTVVAELAANISTAAANVTAAVTNTGFFSWIKFW